MDLRSFLQLHDLLCALQETDVHGGDDWRQASPLLDGETARHLDEFVDGGELLVFRVADVDEATINVVQPNLLARAVVFHLQESSKLSFFKSNFLAKIMTKLLLNC